MRGAMWNSIKRWRKPRFFVSKDPALPVPATRAERAARIAGLSNELDKLAQAFLS